MVFLLIDTILIGLGATLTFDLWAIVSQVCLQDYAIKLLSGWSLDFDICPKEFLDIQILDLCPRKAENAR